MAQIMPTLGPKVYMRLVGFPGFSFAGELTIECSGNYLGFAADRFSTIHHAIRSYIHVQCRNRSHNCAKRQLLKQDM